MERDFSQIIQADKYETIDEFRTKPGARPIFHNDRGGSNTHLNNSK